jgi:hypothetical protein
VADDTKIHGFTSPQCAGHFIFKALGHPLETRFLVFERVSAGIRETHTLNATRWYSLSACYVTIPYQRSVREYFSISDIFLLSLLCIKNITQYATRRFPNLSKKLIFHKRYK